MLIADSGSTKTTWVEVASGNKTVTDGLNPHFTSDEQFGVAFRTVCSMWGMPDEVFFYGAGCGDERQKQRVARLLKDIFSTDNVNVETDMLGACRAVSHNEASLVGILGTGSNACFYDGSRITNVGCSLGYILGDEGSANHLGRLLVDCYLKGQMSMSLRGLFYDAYPYTYAEWMNHIYHQPNANRFLASLARFAVDHCDIKECTDAIEYVVDRWYSEQLSELIRQTQCHKINVVGSFGKAIETTLRKVLSLYGICVGVVMADPIEALRPYHQSAQY